MSVALGIDLKASGFALGLVVDLPDEGPTFVASEEWYAKPPKSGERVRVAERLYRVGFVLRRRLRSVAHVHGLDAIFVEDPKGRHRAPTLVAAYGVALAAAYEIALEVPGGAIVFTEDATAWRRAVEATSPKGEKDRKLGGVKLAREVGCPPERSEDEHEAVAMAVRALKVLA